MVSKYTGLNQFSIQNSIPAMEIRSSDINTAISNGPSNYYAINLEYKSPKRPRDPENILPEDNNNEYKLPALLPITISSPINNTVEVDDIQLNPIALNSYTSSLPVTRSSSTSSPPRGSLPSSPSSLPLEKSPNSFVEERKQKSALIKDSKKYQCKTCLNCFTTSGHLARHTRIHTGERKHLCPFPDCSSRFARQDNCMQHYRTHFSSGKKKDKSESGKRSK